MTESRRRWLPRPVTLPLMFSLLANAAQALWMAAGDQVVYLQEAEMAELLERTNQGGNSASWSFPLVSNEDLQIVEAGDLITVRGLLANQVRRSIYIWSARRGPK